MVSSRRIRFTACIRYIGALRMNLSATWPSGTASWELNRRDEFELGIEPIVFDMYTEWLLALGAQVHFADLLDCC